MPVPIHYRFVFRGRFQDTEEEWSTSCKFARAVAGASDPGVDIIDQEAVTDALLVLFGSARFQGHIAGVDWRAYAIGTDGKMEGNERLLVDLSASGIGGTSGSQLPPQVSLVATLVANDRGPAKYGRMFLPAPATALGTDYRIPAAAAMAYAEDVSTFLKSVSGAIDVPLSPANKAGVNVSSVGGGHIQDIDHIEVGRVYDTMRSRRTSLVEDRQSTGTIDW